MARRLHTRLCDLLGIEYPIVLAGMARPSGPTLAAAVSNAGGLGIIGATMDEPDDIAAMIRKARSLTSKPFGVDLLIPSAVMESGTAPQLAAELPAEHAAFVKRLQAELKIPEPKEPQKPRTPLTREFYRRQFEVLLDERVPVFASGLGNPAWAVPEAHAHGMKVIGIVGNTRNARRVAEGGVDIIVAQGHEAGGHTGRIGTLALVPQVVDAVSPTPVLAAGGIGDGRGLVAALALGACGAWVGTAFLICHEACVDRLVDNLALAKDADIDRWELELWKHKVIEAEDESTAVSRCYTGMPSRSFRTKWQDAWNRPGAPQMLAMPLQGLLIRDALRGAWEGHIDGIRVMYMGQIAGLIKELKSAQQVVDDMVEEAVRLLKEKLPAEVVIGE